MKKAQLRKVGLTALSWLQDHPELKQHKEAAILNAFFVLMSIGNKPKQLV
jgi:5-formyltetrahydrofolate cyclo-ligase